MPEGSLSITYFLHKVHHSLLVLWNTIYITSIHLETILNSEITDKHKHAKNMALNR